MLSDHPSAIRASRHRAGANAVVVPLRAVDDEFSDSWESAYLDWDEAYLDNVDRLYRLMYSRVGNRPDAEDLTSEVFRSALGPLRIASSKGEVRAYLLATARTVLATHWRRRAGLEVSSIDPERDIEQLSPQAEPDPRGETRQRANQILQALPDRYRRILELRFLETCSIREAARSMEISVSNAKVLQHRALKMAAKAAQEMEG